MPVQVATQEIPLTPGMSCVQVEGVLGGALHGMEDGQSGSAQR